MLFGKYVQAASPASWLFFKDSTCFHSHGIGGYIYCNWYAIPAIYKFFFDAI